MISFAAEEKWFLPLLKDLMFQENKGIIINLNTTCMYAIISIPAPQRIGSARKDKRNATCNIKLGSKYIDYPNK